MDARTLENYGGAFVDAVPVGDGQADQPAEYYNRHAEDTAQLTRTGTRAAFSFLTISSVATLSASTVSVRSYAGSGAVEKPTVARTGTGAYTATFAATFQDGLGETEANSFFWARGAVASTSVFGLVFCRVASNVISIQVVNDAFAPVDITNGTQIVIWAD